MTRQMTCIICPRGCTLQVEQEGERITVSGNACKRGEVYARAECTHPERTLTTTVATEDGGVLPVKTNRPVPKETLFACMKEINRVVAPAHVQPGDVLLHDLLGTGADLVATARR